MLWWVSGVVMDWYFLFVFELLKGIVVVRDV